MSKPINRPVYLKILTRYLLLVCLLPATGVHAGLTPARGMLLVASQSMQDETFGNTVILILNHDEQGTFGLMINRRSNLSASEIMPEVVWNGNAPQVYLGGPVALHSVRILIRSDEALPVGTQITDQVWIIDSAPGLAQYARDLAGHLHSKVYLGYAGWYAGQLEAEILRGDWHIWPGNAASVFSDKPEDLWHEIQQQLRQIWAGVMANLPAMHQK